VAAGVILLPWTAWVDRHRQLRDSTAAPAEGPATGRLAGDDVATQARQILRSFAIMLESVDSDLAHVLHVNVFPYTMTDIEEMNRAYAVGMGDHRPARTVVAVKELPKPGVLLTMNLTAVTRD